MPSDRDAAERAGQLHHVELCTADFEHTETVRFVHTMGDVVTALCDAGLEIDFLHDHPWADFPMYEDMERDDDGRWRLPDDVPVELPLTFSLRAKKPV